MFTNRLRSFCRSHLQFRRTGRAPFTTLGVVEDPEQLDTRLKAFTHSELAQLFRLCGVTKTSNGAKPCLVDRLIAHLSEFEATPSPTYILAIDVGQKLSHTLIKVQQNCEDPSLLVSWGLQPLDMNVELGPSAKLADQISKLVPSNDNNTEEENFKNENCIHVVVDPAQAQDLVFEAALHYLADIPGFEIMSVAPRRVNAWHEVEADDFQTGITVVEGLLKGVGDHILPSPTLESMLQEELDKRNRISLMNSFLNGVAYSDWQRNSMKLLENRRLLPERPKIVRAPSKVTERSIRAALAAEARAARRNKKLKMTKKFPPSNAWSSRYAEAFIKEFTENRHTSYTACAHAIHDLDESFPRAKMTYLLHISLQEFDSRLRVVVPGYISINDEKIASSRYSCQLLLRTIMNGLRLLDPATVPDMFTPAGDLIISTLTRREWDSWLWSYYKDHFLEDARSFSVKACGWALNPSLAAAALVAEHPVKPPPLNPPVEKTNELSRYFAVSFIEELDSHVKVDYSTAVENLAKKSILFPTNILVYKLHVALQEFDRRLLKVVPGYLGISHESIINLPYSPKLMVGIVIDGLKQLEPTSAPEMFSSNGKLDIHEEMVHVELYRWFWKYYQKHIMKEVKNFKLLKECTWRFHENIIYKPKLLTPAMIRVPTTLSRTNAMSLEFAEIYLAEYMNVTSHGKTTDIVAQKYPEFPTSPLFYQLHIAIQEFDSRLHAAVPGYLGLETISSAPFSVIRLITVVKEGLMMLDPASTIDIFEPDGTLVVSKHKKTKEIWRWFWNYHQKHFLINVKDLSKKRECSWRALSLDQNQNPVAVPWHATIEQPSLPLAKTNLLSVNYAKYLIMEVSPMRFPDFRLAARNIRARNPFFPKDEAVYKCHVALQEFNSRLVAVVPGYRDIRAEPIVSEKYSVMRLFDAVLDGLRRLDPSTTEDLFTPWGVLIPGTIVSQDDKYRWLWKYHKTHFLKDAKNIVDITECHWRAAKDVEPIELVKVPPLPSTKTNALSEFYAKAFLAEFSRSKSKSYGSVADAVKMKYPVCPTEHIVYVVHIALQEFNSRLLKVVPGYTGISSEHVVSSVYSMTSLMNIVIEGMQNLDAASAPDIFDANGSLPVQKLKLYEKYYWFWRYHQTHFLVDHYNLFNLKPCLWKVRTDPVPITTSPSANLFVKTNSLSVKYADMFVKEYVRTKATACTPVARKLHMKNRDLPFDSIIYKVHIALHEFNRRLLRVLPGYSGITSKYVLSDKYSIKNLIAIVAEGLIHLEPSTVPEMFDKDGTLLLSRLYRNNLYLWFWKYYTKHMLVSPKNLVELKECRWRVKSQEIEKKDEADV
ncbi:hypothetical protein BDR26DRAFT_1006862 [Obelidium mucronatum]|nr:hypothetical protein BDR26DRAFT_1006862 [Obelidium mucronatum]